MTTTNLTSDEREQRDDLDKWDAINWMLNVFSNEEFTFAQKVEALEDYRRRAATRMRDKCVEKVKEVLRPYELEFRQKTEGRFATNMVDYTAMVLESLTLDQVEQKP